ncbi:putative 2-dehydropantoate 2-reductase [Candida viswanathii]|uniref:2-dehydropantoate 2-reductase n=1 Tax=Candida viswanathii TaxID=5486 RepID=A0A367YH80_9ASCO|nr:putative 2-dehydropantoate 2-reductase [Candida viswanathii]
MSLPLKVHILGVGAIGSLLAYDLKRVFPQVISPVLLLRPKSTVNPSQEHKIYVSRIKNSQLSTQGIETESVKPHLVTDPIENLIITTKAPQTEEALLPYLPHIRPTTNIFILQNGMGMGRNLVDKFWNTANARPTIFEGITTHGAYVHNGITHHVAEGAISIGELPGNIPGQPDRFLSPEERPEMITSLLKIPELNAKMLNYEEFVRTQAEKLIVNCCINALTALFDCKNGELMCGDDVRYLWRHIINEAKEVLIAEYPALVKLSESQQMLDTDRLLAKVIDVVDLTKDNSSSMRQDIRNLRVTEIDSINGYIGYLGRKHGLAVPVNRTLTSMIKSKLSIDRGIDQAAAEKVLQI